MAESGPSPTEQIPPQGPAGPGFYADDRSVFEASSRIGHLEAELAQALEALQSAQHRIAAAETRAERMEGERISAAAELELTRMKLDAMNASHMLLINSKSWRVTEPLRAGLHAFRRARKTLARLKLERPANGWPRLHWPRRRRLDAGTIAALMAETALRGLEREADRFVLYRIIGNDHQPRHIAGQSRRNVEFILDHEVEFEACEKRWIVNRIVDAGEEAKIIELLEARGQSYLRIPFVAEDYRNIPWDFSTIPAGFLAGKEFDALPEQDKARVLGALYRHRNNYLMNNNGARNVALADGRARAKWILPFDGNCFLTEAAWGAIRQAIGRASYLKYFIVPMHRVGSNAELLGNSAPMRPDEEPQILFRRDAEMSFDEARAYGRRPKVELLWRLGVPGPWDGWLDDPWDLKRPALADEAGQFARAGWIARMESGVGAVEKFGTQHFKLRGRLRQAGILATINAVDAQLAQRDLETLFYAPERLAELQRDLEAESPHQGLARRIVDDAEAALGRGPFSVTQKPAPGPSGNIHDYWHPAPYWWPNPDSADGLPYLRRDGQRLPGTTLYEPGSERFDRSRLQRVFDDTTSLALAWAITGKRRYASHGARLVANWFLDEATRMTPHLGYAQVIAGRTGNRGGRSGCIEFKDCRYFLDAVLLLAQSGTLDEADLGALRKWFAGYFEWLETSPQGRQERLTLNNHGIHYDLQFAAIAAFVGDRVRLTQAVLRGLDRLRTQVAADGQMPEEMRRANSAHYVAFALMGWLDLIRLGQSSGVLGPSLQETPFVDLRRAIAHFLEHVPRRWPPSGVEGFDMNRAAILRVIASEFGLAEPSATEVDPALPVDPYSGIVPYWTLALNSTAARAVS